MIRILFFINLSVLFFSCKDAQKVNYLDQIDRMSFQLDSMELLANDNRVDTLTQITLGIKDKIKEVGMHYKSDTVNYESVKLMNAFKSSQKALSTNSGNIAKVLKAIPEVREKLEDLHFDIKNGLGERDKYEEHISFEREKVRQIQEILSYYIQTKDKYLSLYIETLPKVDSLIDVLKNEE